MHLRSSSHSHMKSSVSHFVNCSHLCFLLQQQLHHLCIPVLDCSQEWGITLYCSNLQVRVGIQNNSHNTGVVLFYCPVETSFVLFPLNIENSLSNGQWTFFLPLCPHQRIFLTKLQQWLCVRLCKPELDLCLRHGPEFRKASLYRKINHSHLKVNISPCSYQLIHNVLDPHCWESKTDRQ